MNTKVLHQFLILGMLPALKSDVDRLSTTTTLTMLQKSCAETSAKLHSTDVALTRMVANQHDNILAYLMRAEKNQQEFLSRFGQEEFLLKRKASSIGSPTTDASVAASAIMSLALDATNETGTATKKAKTSA